ncbi:hypothetical protein [Lewinella sp. W8]|uniref:hypothetical protein n=1 Tax=Lewinella sp. W8 TaxID=2528208 RepID=UPI0010676C1A|nr:hypothetical protein [Lewinella sp. W8]MTB50800.1 hypothetical protein [Lewinella sp. W8]
MKIPHLFLFCLTLCCFGCGNDDDPSPMNDGAFTFMGETQKLPNAHIYEYTADPTSRMHYYLDLTTDELTVIEEGRCNDGKGDAVVFRLNIPDNRAQISGTYTFSEGSDETYTMWQLAVLRGVETTTEDCNAVRGTFYRAISGELDLTLSGDQLDLTFTMTDRWGNEATGFYRGEVRTFP